MKLNQKDIELFKNLNKSQTGKDLVDYLERLKIDLTDILTITPENLEARKETVKAIEESLIRRIRMVNEEKVVDNNPYV